jgi:mRNA interferase RelE/StbE
MEYKVVYSNYAIECLKSLPKNISKRIVNKVNFFCKSENPLSFAKKLQNFTFGQYRFRVGNYRVLFDLHKNGEINIIFVLSIKHRRNAYVD